MTEQEKIELGIALERLDDASTAVAEVSRSTAVARAPLAQVQAGLEQATREVWRKLQEVSGV